MCVSHAQGFVSNRDSERNEDKADPIEIILYAVFVATSARASVAELADILQVRALAYTCPVHVISDITSKGPAPYGSICCEPATLNCCEGQLRKAS